MIKNQSPSKLEGIHSDYDESQVVIFGVPFDGTVSGRPGTRFGPQAIRCEMDGLETYSPYLDKDLVDYRFCELGDMELSFGNTDKVLERIGQETRDILADGKKTLALGGEHLVSLPIISAYIDQFPDIQVLHFDAHTDLREDYLGEPMSHATVMRKVYDKLGHSGIWQFGIRSGMKEEFAFAKEHIHICKFDLGGLSQAVRAIGNKPVYVSIDLDVLDPSIFSGTGTPEPGGISFKELINGFTQMRALNVVGADIVELAPHYDQSGVSTAVACKVLRELLLIMAD